MLTKADLHDYQIDTITEMYERDQLLAIVPMGGGKTVSALTAIQELKRDGHVRSAVVVAPRRVAHEVWPAEIALWAHLQDLTLVLVDGDPAQRLKKLNSPADIYVIGIDNTKWLTEQIETWDDDDPRLDLLAIDELSRYKSPTGRRSRALSFLSHRFKIRWGLTGTPSPNGEHDLYQPIRILTDDRIWDTAFTVWRMKYFIPDDPYTQFSWTLREEWQDKIWGDVAKVAYVVDPERLPAEPELRTIPHLITPTEEVRKVYAQMLRDLVAELRTEDVVALNRAVAAGKLDQIAQGFMYTEGGHEVLHELKLQKLDDILGAAGGEQVMITYWFKEDLEALRRLLGQKLPVLGSVTSDARASEVVRQWNDRKIQYVAVHPASAGHGLNLQKGSAGQIVHYSPTWSPELYAQVNKRIARQGNERDTVMNHLILLDLPSEHMKFNRVRGKAINERALIDFLKQEPA